MRRLIPALVAWLRNPEIRVIVAPEREIESLRAEVVTLKAEKAKRDPQLLGAQNINYEAMNTNRRLLTENELLRKQIDRLEHEIYIRDHPLPPPPPRRSGGKRKKKDENN